MSCGELCLGWGCEYMSKCASECRREGVSCGELRLGWVCEYREKCNGVLKVIIAALLLLQLDGL